MVEAHYQANYSSATTILKQMLVLCPVYCTVLLCDAIAACALFKGMATFDPY